MKLIKIAAAVLNQTPIDWEGNKARIVAAIAEARGQGASVLCLPELCITGYGCEDAFHSPGLQATAMQVLLELLPFTRGMIVSFGLPVLHDKALYNAAALAVDGALAGFVCKQFLAGDGVHYEPRWFKRWPADHRDTIDIEGIDYPIGDLHFECGGIKIGFEICEDAWVANRPGTELALRGVDVILNPSASHFAFGKFGVRQRFVIEGSRAFGVAYVYSNLLGNESGRVIFDGGALIASSGTLIARGSRFSFQDLGITLATVDIDALRLEQVRRGSHRPMHDEADECVEVEFSWPKLKPIKPALEVESWEDSRRVKEEEFSRAIALGLVDYLRKSRSRGFVVSLSGGADSAATACLVALAIEFGVAELGVEQFAARIGFADAGARSVRELTTKLLTCAYQGTANSSETTRNAARAVAEAIGATYYVLEIDALVDGYVKLIEGALGRRLEWATDDVALQNIQARTRGPSVWLLANLQNALLLATSNRSEAAVGYATMDGDTCGGLSPIAGIDKAFLRGWLRWLEAVGPTGAWALPALAAVNVQAPTAELRPPSAEQTDEGDLMPYEILDAIEGAAIRDKRAPLEVFFEIEARFGEYPRQVLGAWVAKFFRLWCRNQWKRERYAPSFHVDDKNLDPKTWCRFPILSGGFERELAELAAHLVEEGAAE